MKQIKCENNTIAYKKSEIKLITLITNFRAIIKIYGFKYRRAVIKNLRKSFRSHEKIVYDEDENDIEYLQDRINYLNSLKNGYLKQNQY